MSLGVRMIAYHQRNLAGKFADTLPIEQIDQAMIVFRYENRYTWPVLGSRDTPLNRELLRDRLEPLREIFQVELKSRQVPFHARRIEALFSRLVLLEMQNVPAVPVNEVRDRRIETLAVRTFQKQDGAVLHLILPTGPAFYSNWCASEIGRAHV